MAGRMLIAAFFFACAAPAQAWELKVCADPDGAPYSSADGSGFENRIAAVLADELGAEATFAWMPDHRSRTARAHLHAGLCDVLMGVLDGQPGTLTTHAVYRTGYVFVTRQGGPETASLHDDSLGGFRIGVPGGARRMPPPAISLARRGHRENLRFFGSSAVSGASDRALLAALDAGEIDIAILWGPMAGALAAENHEIRPVQPEIDIPFLPMFAALSMGVRPHDRALRDALDLALAARWDEVRAILAEARVPLLALPRLVRATAP